MIDWPRVMQLRDEVGADDFDEVVDLFLEEVREVMAQLRTDAARAETERHLHFLKGSALSLGFRDFSNLCQDGERQSAAGDVTAVDLSAIIRCFEESRTVFQAEIANRL